MNTKIFGLMINIILKTFKFERPEDTNHIFSHFCNIINNKILIPNFKFSLFVFSNSVEY